MQLSEQRWAEIEAKLPKAVDVQSRLLLRIEFISLKSGWNSKLDVATVCLRDASEVACDAVYALRQAYANLIWFREDAPDAPQELNACNFCKFYIDDVALRLYASAEHIRNFVIGFFDIQKPSLKLFGKRGSSKFDIVSKYLYKEMPSHAMTVAIRELLSNGDWEKVIDYRNTWVHQQPPLIAGLGIVYKRKSRWTNSNNSHKLGLGGGDKPDITVDELLEGVSSATHSLVNLLAELTNLLYARLNESGINVNEKGQMRISI